MQAFNSLTRPNDKSSFDVVIIGGGLVGLSAALALSTLSRKDQARPLNIAIVEASSVSNEDYVADDDPSTTALSYGSRLIYESIDVWKAIKPYVQPIHNIHVSDRGSFARMCMSAKEYKVAALGYVVPNKQLLSSLVKAVKKCPEITFFRPANIKTLNMHEQGSTLQVEQTSVFKQLEAGLVILADGGRSPLMRQMGFSPTIKTYGHTAILSTVMHAKKHNAVAYERFTEEGPMAMLPILEGSEHKSAMIWTMPSVLAEERMQLPDTYFVRELQDRFGYRLGCFDQVGKCLQFPLTLKTVAEPARQGAVLLGNSAHSLHPVAGQGYNLALRDTIILASVLTESHNSQNLGSHSLLQQYLNRQRSDQQSAIYFSDTLVQLFSSNSPVLKGARGLGMLLLNHCSPVKQWFGHKAMGIGGFG